MLPPQIKKFIEVFSALPSIGPRQATRLAFHIKNMGDAAIKELSQTINDLNGIETCSQCFFTYDKRQLKPEASNNLCAICRNPQRRRDIIAIVEKETDLISLEKTKKFFGRYLVLGELKKDSILNSVQKLRLNNLKSFIKKELNSSAEEIILALGLKPYGDLNASLINQEVKDLTKKITRLGRGIPTGGEIEFADEDTLEGALANRGAI